MPPPPAGDRGDIIITSRNPECRQYNTVGCQEIGRMSYEDAEALLLKTACSGTAPEVHFHREGRIIVETLGRLALAILQAGAYIRETSCPPEEYLEHYRRCQKEVLGYFPKHNGTDYRYTVYTTWQVSLDMIESLHDTTSNYALELLRLLCFYHHDQVPVRMFYNAWHNSKENPRAPSFLM
ncbi:hypothetical protein GJ744_003767 [Endocarpon pusillum]|uniref:Uncharacterized protein n=1 Tax=Endocarpon pusillum TaxID=364733 RepID=A0A8H7ANV2_9EURO|nr:hypothetical protein GJ744_003767 [Endocarpon pusillum]